MGFVGTDRAVIDSRTTAEALIYFGCSPSQLGEAFQFALRKVLMTHTLVTPVVAAVEAAMRAGRVHADDPAVLGLRRKTRGRSSAGRTPAMMLGKGSRRNAQSLSYDNTTHSGMRVIEQAGCDTISLENSFRRRAVATVERFGYTSAAGDIVLTTPTTVGAPFKVDPEDALNLSNAVNALFEKTLEDLLVDIGLIGDYDLGDVPWTAKVSEAFELPLEPADARETYYRVNVVGPGAQGAVTGAGPASRTPPTSSCSSAC